MILTGNEILKQINDGGIAITPFSASNINPNSYNLTLSNEIQIISGLSPLDMKKPSKFSLDTISEDGFCLYPNNLYLARTNEYTETDKFIPMLEGRSSVGRLGMFVHVTAGFGDIGFKGYWTLEIVVVRPIIIYPNVKIAQIYYHVPYGDITLYDSGKYQENKGIQISKLYEEFEYVDDK